MRKMLPCTIVCFTLFAAAFAYAQGPARLERGGSPNDSPGGPQPSGGQNATTATADAFTARLLTLDTDGDGVLSKTEVTDSRLFALLTRADADGDGKVTKQEMAALYAKEAATLNSGRMRGGPGGRGPGGPGGPPPGGMRRPGGPPPGLPPQE